MFSNLKIGLEARVEKIVTDKDTAAEFGSGDIYVFASPVMIGLMENASLNAVDKELGNEYSTVGINVNVNHISATPVGQKVYAVAKLIEIDGKKLCFKVEAYDENKKIGEGTHTRYIVNIEKFLNKIKN
ncbi:thioesterase family protein [Abyssisolibacter fermentans]|uniref:thioesterase family protein n=1 Tax=Abyssisolibacter fermentans TaxID=1766203 RepID=UPI000830C7E8|nr:thioesterase family protein [Abyssisolibacter fermentans]